MKFRFFTLLAALFWGYAAQAQCPTCGNGVLDGGETNVTCPQDAAHNATAVSPCAQPGAVESVAGLRQAYDFTGTTTYGATALPTGWTFAGAPTATTAGALPAADTYGAKAGTVQPNCSGSCTSTNGFCIGNMANLVAVGSGGVSGKLGANFDGRANVSQDLSYAVLRGQGSPTLVSPTYDMSGVEGFKVQLWLMPSETSCGQTNSWGSCVGNTAYLDFSTNGGTSWTQVLTLDLNTSSSDMCFNNGTNTKWLTEGAWSRLCLTVFKTSTATGNFYTAASTSTAASGIMVNGTYFTSSFKFRIRYSQSASCTAGVTATNPGRYLAIDFPVVTSGNQLIPCGISFVNMAGYASDNNDDGVGSSSATTTTLAYGTVKRSVNQAERGVEILTSQTSSFSAQNLTGSSLASNFDLCNAEGGDKQCIDWRTNNNLYTVVYECVADWEAPSGTGINLQYYKGTTPQSVGMTKVTTVGKTALIGWRYSANRFVSAGSLSDLNPGCNGYSFQSGSLPTQFGRGFYALSTNSLGQAWSYYGASSCSHYFNGPTFAPIASIDTVGGVPNYILLCSGGNAVFTAKTKFASDAAGFTGQPTFTVTGPGGFSETIVSGAAGTTPITTAGTYTLTPSVPSTPTQCLNCARSLCITVTAADLTPPNWYLDADNDGYYVGTPLSQCTSPGAGYNTTANTAGDCDDNDPAVWQTLSGYTDADGDGYTVGAVQSVCAGASLPAGYSANSAGTDCDDTHSSLQTGCGSHFITTWNLAATGSSPTQISFGVATTGVVSYNWQQTVGGNATGSGTFSGSTATIAGLPAMGTIRLYISPTNFSRFYILQGNLDENRLNDVNQWGTTAWNSMKDAFRGCLSMNITATDIPNLAGVSDASGMFQGCQSLTGPANIGSWNTGNITNMELLFNNCNAFNQPIGSWNTSLVQNMFGMFAGASQFNQPIGGWNTAQVTDMGNMFALCSSFNQPIGNWNTGLVYNLSGMFSQALAFNQPLNNWNTSSVITINGMFNGAATFNQPLNNWNTADIQDMYGVFGYASAFNQPLNNWSLASMVQINGFFDYSGMDCANYSTTLNGWGYAPYTPAGMVLGATGLSYGTNADAGRNNLLANGWNIIGDSPSGTVCGSSVPPVTLGVQLDITGTQIICYNQVVVVHALTTVTGCSTIFQWFEDGVPITGATTSQLTLNRWSVGKFYVRATCGSSFVFSDTLNVNIVEFAADSNKVCTSTGLLLHGPVVPGATYQWTEGSLTGPVLGTGVNYTTTYIGNVWCKVFNGICYKYGKFRTFESGACPPSSAKRNETENMEQWEEETTEADFGFNMYPNPANSQVTISSSYLYGSNELCVFDLNGRMVLCQSNLLGNLHIIDVRSLSPAVYIVTLSAEGKTERQRLVVQ